MTEIINEDWDAVICGSGMGGSVMAHSLANKGYRVLVIEKGLSSFSNDDHEAHLNDEAAKERLEHGAWPTKITRNEKGVRSHFFGSIGCGAGGSTLLYAAALERFEPNDFDNPDNDWPFSYQTLLPYYRRAENLFKVRGSQDPLNTDSDSELLPPVNMSECDEHFFTSFEKNGLHPYRLHVAIDYKDKCDECLGYICNQRCKSDAKTICLDPAIKTGQVTLLDQCEVISIDASADSVNKVICLKDGKEIEIKTNILILAAGAYFSPVLLQNSTNEFWPKGLANKSDMVGRNLMFHISDFIAVWPRGKFDRKGPAKTISLRDFYFHEGQSLGSFQSTGLTVKYGNVVYALRTKFDRSRWSWLKPLRPLLRIPAFLASFFLGPATVFTTIMEDRPYPENRIIADPNDPSGMHFNYVVHEELNDRIKLFRKILKSTLSPHRLFVLSEDASLNYGHPCGTCKMGDDPKTSVVDKDCKAHGIDNLYIVDASVMPTSGGANPSLTIAANALRVADIINDKLQS